MFSRFSLSLCKRFAQPFHLQKLTFSNAAASTQLSQKQTSSRKDLLLGLRKQTGLPFSQCKLAADKFEPSQLGEALEWLRNEAKAKGWNKIAKVSTRPTLQGCLGVAKTPSSIVVLQALCETDFVAKNDAFQEFAKEVTSLVSEKCSDGNSFDVSPDILSSTCGDRVANAVAALGENIRIPGAKVWPIQNGPSKMTAYFVHGSKTTNDTTQVGRFISIADFKLLDGILEPEIASLTVHAANQVCQHIVGCSPLTINPTDKEKEALTKLAEGQNSAPTPDIEELEGVADDIKEEEDIQKHSTSLLSQPFLFDETETVKSFLTEHNLEIEKFARFDLNLNFDPSTSENSVNVVTH